MYGIDYYVTGAIFFTVMTSPIWVVLIIWYRS